MGIWQNTKKKKYLLLAVFVVVLLILSLFFFQRKLELAPEPVVEERDAREGEIQRQIKELDVLREERLGGEAVFTPDLVEEEIQRQIEELDALRQKQNQSQ